MAASQLSIAIIGAGPAGLTLARLLHVNNISYVLYERESSRSARPQGGTLDLHEATGQRALRAAGLYGEFEKIMRTEGEAMRIADKSGVALIDEETPGLNRPEIDRLELRKLLIDSIPRESIHWSANVLGIVPSTSVSGAGRWTVVLEDNSPAADFDLIVGADGAWSKIRPFVTDAAPFYSGIGFVEFRFSDIDSKMPSISRYVGKGSHYDFSDNKALISQRNGDGTIRVYAGFRVAESWFENSDIDFKNPSTIKRFLVEQFFNDWSDIQKDLIQLADDDYIIPRQLYMMPVGHEWSPCRGVTLLGDAAHLMTPFAGEGLNVGMRDALELSQKLVTVKREGTLVTAAVEKYERDMFERAKLVTEKTYQNMELMFCEDAPRELLEYVKKGGFAAST